MNDKESTLAFEHRIIENSSRLKRIYTLSYSAVERTFSVNAFQNNGGCYYLHSIQDVMDVANRFACGSYSWNIYTFQVFQVFQDSPFIHHVTFSEGVF